MEEVDCVNFLFFNCIVKEILWFYFFLFFVIFYFSVEECIFGGYCILVNIIVYVNIYVIGRDVVIWENLNWFNFIRFKDFKVNVYGYDFNFLLFLLG